MASTAKPKGRSSAGSGQAWEAGRAARRRITRKGLGAWSAPAGRLDPVAVLQAQDTDRVAELVPLRYERMTASPFAFYRGAAAIMARGLGSRPHTELGVQLCGDAHLANFGGFATPDRTMVFDVNDFDETLPGPFEWDVQRLVASFEVAGRHKGFTAKQCSDLVALVARTYREAITAFAGSTTLDVWYARMSAQDILDRWGAGADATRIANFRKMIAKGQSKTSSQAVSRYTKVGGDGSLHLVSQPPLVVPAAELSAAAGLGDLESVTAAVLAAYRESLSPDRATLLSRFQPVDSARKVVGVGSVGTRCWIVLLVATDDPSDDLVLQCKQAGPSVLESALPGSVYDNHGRRVVEGQRMIQTASDLLLGWTREQAPQAGEEQRPEVDFYVRQMWDWKTSANLESMDGGYRIYVRICGWTLARAHARSGSRKALAAYLGSSETFDKAMIEFAGTYADQNQADFDALMAAVKDGRVVRSNLESGGATIDMG